MNQLSIICRRSVWKYHYFRWVWLSHLRTEWNLPEISGKVGARRLWWKLPWNGHILRERRGQWVGGSLITECMGVQERAGIIAITVTSVSISLQLSREELIHFYLHTAGVPNQGTLLVWRRTWLWHTFPAAFPYCSHSSGGVVWHIICLWEQGAMKAPQPHLPNTQTPPCPP